MTVTGHFYTLEHLATTPMIGQEFAQAPSVGDVVDLGFRGMWRIERVRWLAGVQGEVCSVFQAFCSRQPESNGDRP